MVADVSTGDPTRMLCLNCARRIVSPRTVSKYDGLGSYLKFRGSFTDTVKLELAKIDGIIGDNLPMGAYKDAKWWGNMPSNVHARSWLDAGWEMCETNLKEGYVIFKKVRETPITRHKKVSNRIEKVFTPVRVRTTKPRTPSKTKASKLYARIKNMERQKALRARHGSFKPKSTFEKKLFKPDQKPQ